MTTMQLDSVDGCADDDTSDGTGFGEGVAAVIIKPLQKALKDGDQIYAVIKGSAINQDGSSVGITAPNPIAQEEVILEAWKDAGITPESISYIEAHGTGTRLGDPIEIRAITQAFYKHTNAKQFCAIGSIKSNIGHLDNAAGIAGLVKCILSLRHGVIPPSLFFQKPNRGIAFEDSPVYVNDRLQEWNTDGMIRRCGISAFGLSGTNCHLVLEEAPYSPSSARKEAGIQILCISALAQDGLLKLVEQYKTWIEQNEDVRLSDICNTLNTGRGHYTNRIALCFKSRPELLKQLERLLSHPEMDDHAEQGIYRGKHKLVPDSLRKKMLEPYEITQTRVDELNCAASAAVDEMIKDGIAKHTLHTVCESYVNGASVDWELLYRGRMQRKINLPHYPFKDHRCWLSVRESDNALYEYESHPIVRDMEARPDGTIICYAELSAEKDWVLKEHKVNGYYVLPGTAYLEIAAEASRRCGLQGTIEFSDVIFVSPISLIKEETVKIIATMKKRKDGFKFVITDAASHTVYAQGKIDVSNKEAKRQDIDRIIQQIGAPMETVHSSDDRGLIERGPRWRCLQEIAVAEREVLARLQLPERFKDDLSQFKWHPALLDCAANAIIDHFDGLYLPFSYKRITLLGSGLPDQIYSHIQIRNDQEMQDAITFDVTITDQYGNTIISIEQYTIRKVHLAENRDAKGTDDIVLLVPQWVEMSLPDTIAGTATNGLVVIVRGQGEKEQALADIIRLSSEETIEMVYGINETLHSGNLYSINEKDNNYGKLFERLQGRRVSRIIHLASLGGSSEITAIEQLENHLNRGVYSLFHLIKSILENKVKGSTELILISDYAGEVTGNEPYLHPHNAALFAMGKVISQEYPNLSCRTIDIDQDTELENVSAELRYGEKDYQIAYRQGKRYTENKETLDINDVDSQAVPIKNDGVYVITGGLGSLGLEVAGLLASRNPKVSLALLNRTGLPERSEWGQAIVSSSDKKANKRIQKVLELEQLGAEVSIIEADVANMDIMKQVVNQLRDQYGNIRGVIHCAGVAGEGFLLTKPFERFQEVISSKVQGTWVLEQLLGKDEADFVVYFSSINSLIGGYGQSDYAAANAYLNATASRLAKQGAKVKAIHWPAWAEVGMAVDNQVVHDMDSIVSALSIKDALFCFEYIIGSNLVNVLPGRINRKADEFTGGKYQTIQLLHKQVASTKEKVGGSLQGASLQIEQQVIHVFSEVLGLEEMNAHDSFFDWGGDSIIATHLFKALDEHYEGYVDIADIFTYSTPAELAEIIARNMKTQKPVESRPQEDVLGWALQRLAAGEISVDDMERIVVEKYK